LNFSVLAQNKIGFVVVVVVGLPKMVLNMRISESKIITIYIKKNSRFRDFFVLNESF
jgi:hypothetical protein